MWDNDTVLAFNTEEKNWFAKRGASVLKDIGFNAGQRNYLLNLGNQEGSMVKPRGFKKYPLSFPKNTTDYTLFVSMEAAQTSASMSNWIFDNTISTQSIQPQSAPINTPSSWSDNDVINLPSANKKWLASRLIVELKSWGFNTNQANHLRECGGYAGPTLRPNFAIPSNNPLSGTITLDSTESEDSEIEEESSVNPLIETAHDLEVKYLDCLGVKGNDVIRAGGFRSENNKNYIQYRKLDANGNTSSTIESEYNDSFNFTLPKLGMINYNDHVIYIERAHKKSSPGKYRKGLRSDGLKYFNLSPKELKSIGKTDITNPDMYNYEDSARRLAMALFFPKTFTFKEAIDEVVSFNRLSAAFTSSLAIKLDSNLNKIILQKHNWLVGEYNPKNNLFEMYIDTFNEDLKKLNIPFKVAA